MRINRTFILFIFFIASIPILTGFIWNALAKFAGKNLSSYQNYERLEVLINNFPLIINSNKPINLVFGASSVDGFFNPLKFDIISQKSSDSLSYNLGFRAIHPLQQKFLIEYLGENFKNTNKIVNKSIFRLETSRLTKKFKNWNTLNKTDLEDFECPMENMNTIFTNFWNDPLNKITILIKKYIYRCSSSSYFRSWIDSTFKPKNLPEVDLFFSLWQNNLFKDKIAWDIKTRGLNVWNKPNSDTELNELLLKKSSEIQVPVAWRYFNDCCDLANLDWDADLVETFLETIKESSKYSKNVVVYYYSEKAANLNRSALGNENLLFLISLIQKKGYKVINLDESVIFESSDYVDILHLTDSGSEKLYTALAKNK